MNAFQDNLERIHQQFSACRDAAELRALIESLCKEFGRVLNVTLMCGSSHPHKRLCVIDLIPGDTDVQSCAHHLGGRVFGYSSVIVDVVAHPDFRCPKNVQPIPSGCSCVAK